MTAVSQVRALTPGTDIVALEKSRWTSYSACGIPYVLSGDVEQVESLVARSPGEHRDRHRVDVRTGHEAVALDLHHRRVEVRDHAQGRTYRLGFDHVLVA